MKLAQFEATAEEHRIRQDPNRIVGRLEAAFEERHTDPDRGEQIAKEELEAAEARGNVYAIAVAHLVLVYCGPIAEKVDEIVVRLREGCDVFEKVGDIRNLVRAADLLATVYEGMGDYPTALHYSEMVLNQSRKIGYRLFEAYGLSSLAGILTATGDLVAAERKTQAALEIAQELESERMESRLRLRLGRINFERGLRKEAEGNFLEARRLGESSDNIFAVVDAMADLGRVYEADGRWAEAEAAYEEALRIADEDAKRLAGPSIRLGLGCLYLRMGRLQEARDTLGGISELAQGFNMVPVQSQAAEALAQVFEQLGEPEKALVQLRRHIELREKTMEGETQRAVRRFQVKVEIEAARKDAEIHRLKYVELRTAQTQLIEAERLAAAGNLAAGLAHEMNTPLGVIRSSMDVVERGLARIQSELPNDISSRLQRSVDAVVSAGETSRTALARIQSLVTSLRRFTRLDEAELQQLDLTEDLQTTLDLLRPSVPEGIVLECRLAPVPQIWGWPGLLNQAFLTLLVNAVEALGKSGRVWIETIPEDNVSSVRIADDGPGIPPDVLERLFDLEFKQDGQRTRFRVGLATVQSIVHRHQGQIDVDSSPDRGTTFTLRFPLRPRPGPH